MYVSKLTNFIKSYFSFEFYKISVFTSIISLLKVLSGLFLSKIVAINSGPSGLALYGQAISFLTMFSGFSNFAINSGVIKYISQYKSDQKKIYEVIDAALCITIICSLITVLSVILFSEKLSLLYFYNYKYSILLILASFFLIFTSINSLLNSILNAEGNLKFFAVINIVQILALISISIPFAYHWSWVGVFCGMFISPLIALFLSALLIKKNGNSFILNYRIKKIKFDLTQIKTLLYFSLIPLTTALVYPIFQFIIRSIIKNKIDLNTVGYWQALSRISDGYLLFITSVITMHFYPKFSSISHNKYLLKSEVSSAFKKILPPFIICLFFVNLFRDYLIIILYDDEFVQISKMFQYQIIGDLIKIMSFILSYSLIAQAQIKVFVIFEISATCINILLCTIFIDIYGLFGVYLSYIIGNCIYFMLVYLRFSERLFMSSYFTD